MANPKTDKSEALFRSYGTFIESLNGRYITAEDCRHRCERYGIYFHGDAERGGVAKTHGGSGDPSPWTAKGCLEGIRAAVEIKLGRDSLNGLSVAVQGAGNVGRELINLFLVNGMRVTVCDIDRARCDELAQRENVTVVSTDEIYDVDADIFCPCALGAMLNEKTIPRLKCKIVAGSANQSARQSRGGRRTFSS